MKDCTSEDDPDRHRETANRRRRLLRQITRREEKIATLRHEQIALRRELHQTRERS